MVKLRPRLQRDGRQLCGRIRCPGELPRLLIAAQEPRLRSSQIRVDLDGWTFVRGAFERTPGGRTDRRAARRTWPGSKITERVLFFVPGSEGGYPARFRCPRCDQVNELDAVLLTEQPK
jgi:hypothetical protein